MLPTDKTDFQDAPLLRMSTVIYFFGNSFSNLLACVVSCPCLLSVVWKIRKREERKSKERETAVI